MKNTFFIALALFTLLGAGCGASAPTETPSETNGSSSSSMTKTWTFAGALPAEQIENKQVRITTEKGDVVFTLFADTAPITVSNMVALAQQGYFDGLTFHRRVEGFVLQGGDPKGNGSGGPGYEFQDELNDDREYTRGIVAMANRGPDTNGSQFFIMLADYPLPKSYTIFGEVTQGMDIVDALGIGDKMLKVTVEDLPTAE